MPYPPCAQTRAKNLALKRARLLPGSFSSPSSTYLLHQAREFQSPRAYIYELSQCSSFTLHASMPHQRRSTDRVVQESDQGAAAMESSPGRAVAPAVPVTAPAMTVGGVLTVAGILLSFGLLALAFVLLLYYFNERDDRGRTSSPSGTAVIRNARGRGVDPEVLRSLPVTVYRAAKDSTEEGVECAVCLAELEDGEEARFLPRCGHGFHAECIDLWLASHSTCPLCRLTVGKSDVSPARPLAALPPVPPEPANYAANLPASFLLGVSDQGALTAVTVTADSDDPSASAAAATAVLVIEIPESSALATPRDVAAKSPGSARLRSLRRLWSFGRPGPATPSCSCAGGSGEGADVEQGISVTVGTRAVEAPPLPPEAAARAPHESRGAAPDLTNSTLTPCTYTCIVAPN